MTRTRPLFTRLFILLAVLFATGHAYAAGGAPPAASTAEATNSDVVLLIAYVLLALVFSFLCSVAEAVLLSITPSFIAGIQEDRPKLAELLLRLKQEKVDQSLAAILTLNTIAHTVGAIGSGAKATIVFGSAWFGVFSAVMTLLILFLSEIIPKTLGAVFWRTLVRPTALFIQALIFLMYPLIWISEKLTKLISHGKELHVFSRKEFIAMADVGEQAGKIKERESGIIRNLFKFESIKAKDVMTPRTVIVALQQDLTVTEAIQTHPDTPVSRIPLYKDDVDDISGFILRTDMLLAKAKEEGETRLVDLQREIITVPCETPLSVLLEMFLDQRQHIAVAVDEYGGTRGLVTLEDVVETLLGMEIVDEVDTVEDMQAFARRQWEKRAKAIGIQPDSPPPEPDEPPAGE